MKVVYLDEIRDDLVASMDWYDEIRDGLGEEFENEFYAAVSTVCDRPESIGVDRTGYRSYRLRRFTAVLYYCIKNDAIVFAGLATGGEDEGKLDGRG